MSVEFDTVVRGGLVCDGSGRPTWEGDVAVSAGKIVRTGVVAGRGREEVDARGLLVTPGFVDVHTHYDGQVTWEHQLAPSSQHGVTTAVMGNCGVGFAPCRPEQREMLVKLMEGVEDIPEAVMVEGLPWNWITFPDYLYALSGRAADIDFAAQLPHSALRVYVMGQRGADREPATAEDLATMTRLTAEAVRAGALGVTTSHSFNHRSVDGALAPSVASADAELMALALGLREAGAGVMQMIHEATQDPGPQFGLMRALARAAGRPLSFSMILRASEPGVWIKMLDELDEAAVEGLQIRAQVFPRPVGIFYGLELSLHPFAFSPSFQALAGLPLGDKVRAMRDPEVKRRLLAEVPIHANPFLLKQASRLEDIYPLSNPPNYEPSAEMSYAAKAKQTGQPLLALIYEALLEDDGRRLLYAPGVNWVNNRLDEVAQMMAHDHTILGLGDGGAHCGIICDGSYPTYVLTRWVRDAPPSERFDLPWAISALARKPAEAVGLLDRGLLAPGFRADLNLIDLDRLSLQAPKVSHDLPAGGRRLTQRAEGLRSTFVAGQLTYRDGEATGVRPGRLIRGARSRPH
ncbi:MAG TPA: amidohydrolase family protein [Caulobacteraceae bacterium]|nr:amidohydrolase family protein [Caulobacteraceae bacterium]